MHGIKIITLILVSISFLGCSNSGKAAKENLSLWADAESAAPGDVATEAVLGNFDADSAYRYVERQLAFGPRVPNTEAHVKAGDWLAAELRRHGAQVTEQTTWLKAFDGTMLNARNIYGRIPGKGEGAPLLLLAHWDSRPWADQDPDPAKHTLPVEGANDGASGVAILLEIARQLKQNPIDSPVDILFVDAEDWGTDGDDESWALGTKYFMENPPVKNYSPRAAILLDMVGGEGATFCREYFSERSAPELAEAVWQTAARAGYGDVFINKMGSAVMDDHVQLIKAGIPAIDIIDYRLEGGGGFSPRWHTAADNLEGISRQTLRAVGQTLISFLRNY